MNSPIVTTRTLHSLQDIRQYFASRDRAVYFVSPSNFNMMDMHRWVRGWKNINLIDCFDGQHPDVLLVPDDHSRVFSSTEDINHYLMQSPLTRELIQSRTPKAVRDQALFLFFDTTLEHICANDLKLELALPPQSLVREVDSKIVTTDIGNQAGVRSVPNVLACVSSYADLQRLAHDADLGERWVVQTAYGDSGKTTFFIANEADYAAVADQIESESQVKVMRWVRCTGTAIEACATRWGTFVGPLLTELIGAKELTPYAGGWCGNELYKDAFTDALRAQVLEKTQAMGDALYQRGYRGYFELDFLIDQDSGQVYLGELNSRISGVTAITNMSVFSQTHLPLFLFHLLEYDGHVNLTLRANAFNQSVLKNGAQGVSSQLILKATDERLKIITKAPVSGVYRMSAGAFVLEKPSTNRLEALATGQVYVLRIMKEDDYAYQGGDLAIVFLNVVVRTTDGQLNETGREWIAALKNSFSYRDLNQEERSAVALAQQSVNVKSGRST